MAALLGSHTLDLLDEEARLTELVIMGADPGGWHQTRLTAVSAELNRRAAAERSTANAL